MKEKMSYHRIIEIIVHFFTTLSVGGIFVFWLSGLFIVAVLLWGPTSGLRAEAEIKTANRILQSAGEKRSIAKAVSSWLLPGRATQAGNWYVLNDNNVAIIFTVPVDGIFAPFLAMFNAENKINAIYPLSRTAEDYMDRINSNILDMLAARVTNAALLLNNEWR
jgi:hypothetical protein